DGVAINVAIRALGRGDILFLPPGTYRITSTLEVAHREGLTLLGAGNNGIGSLERSTKILWAGPSSGTVLKVESCGWCKFSDFSISGGTDGAGIGIDYTAANAASQRCIFDNLTVSGIVGEPGQALHVGSSTNMEVDQSTFDQILLAHVNVGVYQDGTQTV